MVAPPADGAARLWALGDVVPHIITQSLHLRARESGSHLAKDFCNNICHEQTCATARIASRADMRRGVRSRQFTIKAGIRASVSNVVRKSAGRR